MTAAAFTHVLDTSGILAVLMREAEGPRVQDILRRARDGSDTIALPFLALMEVEYRLLRAFSADDVETSIQTVLGWPVSLVESTEDWRRLAAQVKARGRLSLADSWMAGLALLNNAELVHKDPEFDQVPGLKTARL